MFLAGAGLRDFVANIQKLKAPSGQGADRAHRGGVRMEAAQNPGMTVAPQMAQQMAGGGPQGVPPQLQALLQMLAQRRGVQA